MAVAASNRRLVRTGDIQTNNEISFAHLPPSACVSVHTCVMNQHDCDSCIYRDTPHCKCVHNNLSFLDFFLYSFCECSCIPHKCPFLSLYNSFSVSSVSFFIVAVLFIFSLNEALFVRVIHNLPKQLRLQHFAETGPFPQMLNKKIKKSDIVLDFTAPGALSHSR